MPNVILHTCMQNFNRQLPLIFVACSTQWNGGQTIDYRFSFRFLAITRPNFVNIIKFVFSFEYVELWMYMDFEGPTSH